jgi:hypothetical protein
MLLCHGCRSLYTSRLCRARKPHRSAAAPPFHQTVLSGWGPRGFSHSRSGPRGQGAHEAAQNATAHILHGVGDGRSCPAAVLGRQRGFTLARRERRNPEYLAQRCSAPSIADTTRLRSGLPASAAVSPAGASGGPATDLVLAVLEPGTNGTATAPCAGPRDVPFPGCMRAAPLHSGPRLRCGLRASSSRRPIPADRPGPAGRTGVGMGGWRVAGEPGQAAACRRSQSPTMAELKEGAEVSRPKPPV